MLWRAVSHEKAVGGEARPLISGFGPDIPVKHGAASSPAPDPDHRHKPLNQQDKIFHRAEAAGPLVNVIKT
jgi:hypothetical protein